MNFYSYEHVIIIDLMKNLSTLVLFAVGIATAVARGTRGSLLWHDEFDSNSIDTNKWVFEYGASGWGNNEWEYYTDR